MLSLSTEFDVLRQTAATVKAHRLALRMRQRDLSEKSAVPIGTLRRFERTGNIGLIGLARLLVSLGLADHFVSSFKKAPEGPKSMASFFAESSTKPQRQRARVRRRNV